MTSKVQHRRYRNLISRIRLRAATAALALAVVPMVGSIATPSAQAQTFTTLHSFDGTDGYALFTYGSAGPGHQRKLLRDNVDGGANGWLARSSKSPRVAR